MRWVLHEYEKERIDRLMINRVVLTGRLTKDPEMKMTPNGIPKTEFTLAVNRTFKNQNGEQDADFIKIQCWRKTAEVVADHLRKGSLVGIDGRIQTGSFEGQDGNRVYFTNVVADNVQFLEPKNTQNSTQNQFSSRGNTNYQTPQQNANTGQNQPNFGQIYGQPSNDPFAQSNGPIEANEDDLPF